MSEYSRIVNMIMGIFSMTVLSTSLTIYCRSKLLCGVCSGYLGAPMNAKTLTFCHIHERQSFAVDTHHKAVFLCDIVLLVYI